MRENLKTTRYSNGDLIGTTTPPTMVIEEEASPVYQWAYAGLESNAASYGRLYTWYVATDSRKVCPAGWHVPDDGEWTVLTEYLTNNSFGFGGGYHGMDIAKSMAATSGWVAEETPGWVGNDQESNNSSGFTGLPAGARLEDGNFYDLGHIGNWWSTQRGEGYLQGLTGERVISQGGVFRNTYHDYCYVNSYCK